MKELVLFDTHVRVNEDNLISITDIWHAAKRAGKKVGNLRPVDFMRNQTTIRFINELVKGGILTPFNITKGRNGGTFVTKYLAYEYAGYIDPAFKVGVYTVLDQYFSGKLAQQSSLTTRLEVLTSTLSIEQKHISNPAREMRYWRDIKRGLLEEIAFVTSELQMQLPLN